MQEVFDLLLKINPIQIFIIFNERFNLNLNYKDLTFGIYPVKGKIDNYSYWNLKKDEVYCGIFRDGRNQKFLTFKINGDCTFTYLQATNCKIKTGEIIAIIRENKFNKI